jgi:hypothetical protein
MSCMNHGGRRETSCAGSCDGGGNHLAGKPLMPSTDLHEVTRLFLVRNESRVTCQSWMCSGRRTATNARAIVSNLSRRGTGTCDISAGPFVTTKQQSAGTNRNKEVVFFASCVHVPKLCLGETHVPE